MFKYFVLWFVKRRQAYYARYDKPERLLSKSNYLNGLAKAIDNEQLAHQLGERFPITRMNKQWSIVYPQWEPMRNPDDNSNLDAQIYF
ncbi:hypothetical protein SAMN05444266_102282 [Chitinophaga jiangningensis]|uniref:Uncharacterized protein n=1 Tax=Chitinophaga jiangningensis TaxID=1419482 RepID=A0A1M6YF04_9BACT|nr:hypothetical protein [Chitinophaga jiangningensis]SHL16703.1 hypothetical protein SAMN05444266_102282 [Chitinophaga jiangningensis]